MKLPKKIAVTRQEASPPFFPAMLSLVPSSEAPHGDALAHIPMSDGRTITKREEVIAAHLARVYNSHGALLSALKRNIQTLRDYVEYHNDRWPDEKKDCVRHSKNLAAAESALAAALSR